MPQVGSHRVFQNIFLLVSISYGEIEAFWRSRQSNVETEEGLRPAPHRSYFPRNRIPRLPRLLFGAQSSNPQLLFVFQLARRLLCLRAEDEEMDAVVIVGAVVGSFAGAFVLQKAALEGLFRIMNADRRVRR